MDFSEEMVSPNFEIEVDYSIEEIENLNFEIEKSIPEKNTYQSKVENFLKDDNTKGIQI